MSETLSGIGRYPMMAELSTFGRYTTLHGGYAEPCGSGVLLRRLQYEEMSKGGIVLPDTAREKPYRGTVLAIGPGERDWRTGQMVPVTAVVVGDEVLWLKYAGHEFTLDDEELVVIGDKDVLGKIVEAP